MNFTWKRLAQKGSWAIDLFQNPCDCHPHFITSEVSWPFGSPPEHLHITHSLTPPYTVTSPQSSPVTWFGIYKGCQVMVPFSPISLCCVCSLIVKVTEWTPALFCRFECLDACSLPYQTHNHTMLELSIATGTARMTFILHSQTFILIPAASKH